MSTEAQKSSTKLKLYFYEDKGKIMYAEGIYRAYGERSDPATGKIIPEWEGAFFERPWIDGKRSWRSLETESYKIAKERINDRKLALKRGENPYAPPKPLVSSKNEEERELQEAVLVKQCLDAYEAAGYPDRDRQVRPSDTIEAEQSYIRKLRSFWDPIPVDAITMVALDAYHDARISAKAAEEREAHRKKMAKATGAGDPLKEDPKLDISKVQRVTKGTGDRTVDLELNTLRNSFHCSARLGLINHIPMLGFWPRYHTKKKVQHCKKWMCHDVDEVHAVGALLYGHGKSAVLCFQFVFENYTGLRTCEVLQLRTDAAPNEPGYITPDGKSMFVRRGKGQDDVNAVVFIHEGLAAWLDAHRKWKEQFYPNSPWLFPSPYNASKPVGENALCHALIRLRKPIKRKGKKPLPPMIARKITSHGCRAFYVTVRRSHGIFDSQIAIEIGHTSDGKTLAEVYGGCPPSWLAGYGPKMSWLPKGKLAWNRKPRN